MDRTLRCGSPGDVGMSPERIERIGRLCGEWVEQGITPAIQALVARRGTIVLHGAWGRQGPDDDDPPLTTDSIFGIGSISKTITATIVMSLVEDGLLGLNRPVQEYLPEFAGEGKEQVMVHHLLTHTSGLRNEEVTAHRLARIAAGQAPPREPMPYLRPEEMLHLPDRQDVLDAPLWKAPGAEMSYFSYGYTLLTEIVERVTGQPAERVFQARIFDSLGLTGASFGALPPERLKRYVLRLDDAPWALLNYPDRVRALASGGGAVSLTAFDLAVFGQMFLNGGSYGRARILSPVSIAEMTRNQIPGVSANWAGEYFPEASWGYGWNVQAGKKGLMEPSLLSPTAYCHGGCSMMYIWVDPTYDLVGVYFSVALKKVSERRTNWCGDLFANAVTASIVE